MLEGFLFYDSDEDEWFLSKNDGNNVKVSKLVYAILDLKDHFLVILNMKM